MRMSVEEEDVEITDSEWHSHEHTPQATGKGTKDNQVWHCPLPPIPRGEQPGPPALALGNQENNASDQELQRKRPCVSTAPLMHPVHWKKAQEMQGSIVG